MLQISIFTTVIIVLIFNIILANLVNLAVRETKDSFMGLGIILLYLFLLALTFMYLKSIL